MRVKDLHLHFQDDVLDRNALNNCGLKMTFRFFCASAAVENTENLSQLVSLSAPLEQQVDKATPIYDLTLPSSVLHRYYIQSMLGISDVKCSWREIRGDGGVCRGWGWMEGDDWL